MKLSCLMDVYDVQVDFEYKTLYFFIVVQGQEHVQSWDEGKTFLNFFLQLNLKGGFEIGISQRAVNIEFASFLCCYLHVGRIKRFTESKTGGLFEVYHEICW